MPNWKKVITSGSNAELNQITASSVTIADQITHTGDADTKIEFAADTIGFTAGNRQFLQFAQGTAGGDLIALGGVGGTPPIIQGNITASGNISSSGTIITKNISAGTGNELLINPSANDENFRINNNEGTVFYVDGGTAGGRVGIGNDDDNSFFFSNTNIPTKTLSVRGDISASANIFATEYRFNGIDTRIYNDGNDVSVAPNDSDTVLFQETRTQFTTQVQLTGATSHLTASANISSSLTSTGSFGTLHLEGTNFSSASLAAAIAGGGGGGSMNNFTLTADGGSNQTIADGNTLDIAGGDGITTAVGATDTVTVNVDASQDGHISSILTTDLKLGEDAQTKIDFETVNEIHFDVNNAELFNMTGNQLSGSAVSTGSFGRLDAARVVGTALEGTLTTAAQSNVTSLGTLTTLTVDDITINGSTISDSGDFTLDVGGDITLDADGGDIFFMDNGTTRLAFDTTQGHITASGNISASGNAQVNQITASAFQFVGSGTAELEVEGHITASGNISSSGIITDKLNVNPKNPTSPNMDFGAWNIGYGSTGVEFTGSLPSAGNGYGEIVHFGNGATLTGRIYCLKSDFTWELAAANGNVSSSLLAVAMGTHASASGMLLRGVVYSNAHDTLVIGQKVYNEAGGRVANVAGSDSGDVVRVLGYCVGQPAHIYFNPDNTWVEHS